MIRASFYLLIAGAIWFVEGFLFSRFLAFSTARTAAAAVCYVMLFGVAVRLLLTAYRQDQARGDIARWRYLSLAPMLAVILGSFASLPVMMLILFAGKAL